jgi:hypothetical protein
MKRTCILLITLIFIFLGCGGKDKVKPSADSILATETINVINAIKAAYQEKERDILLNHLAPEIAEDTLKELFFDKAELSFTPRMVRIDASAVMVNINWHGTWFIKGNSLKNRGVAMFIFEGSPTRLVRVDGDNPFHTPFAAPEQKNKNETSTPHQDFDKKQTLPAVEDNQTQHRTKQKLTESNNTQNANDTKPVEIIEKNSKYSEEEETVKLKQLTPETDSFKDREYYVQIGAWKNAKYALEMFEKIKNLLS